MAEEQKCALGMCPEHPHTVERLAMLEKGMESVEISMREAVERLTKVRDATMDEFKAMREDITNGILKRQPPWVTLVISLLFGALCAAVTALINHLD